MPPRRLHDQQPVERFEKFPEPGGVASVRLKSVYARLLFGDQGLSEHDRRIRVVWSLVFHHAGNAEITIWFQARATAPARIAI